MLPAEHSPDSPRVHCLQDVSAPGQDGESVNVRIHRLVLLVTSVGGSVVSVVLVEPPGTAEALEDIAQEVASHCSVQGPQAENLVVEEVMGQPACLLVEQGQDGGREDHREPALAPN